MAVAWLTSFFLPAYGDHCSSLTDLQCSANSYFLYIVWFGCCGRNKDKSVNKDKTVTSSWLEAKLSLSFSFFFQEAAILEMSEPLPTRKETLPSPIDSLFSLRSARSEATAFHTPTHEDKLGNRNLYLSTVTVVTVQNLNS